MSDYLVSSDGLVRNNLFPELGRFNFLPSPAATTESQAMLVRGYARAALVTGNPTYLSQAISLANALLQHYFFGVTPPATGAWPSHWAFNGGDPFQILGPVSSSGAAYDGVVGAATTFTAGVATLSSDLVNVYHVYTGTQQWANVFSVLLSGTTYPINYWIDNNGFKHTPTSIIAPAQTAIPPGTLVLQDTTVNATLSVNYATVQTPSIAHAVPFEAWPMWRNVQTGEANTAGDSIHWMIDAFDLLSGLDTNAVWGEAHTALLNMWQQCCTIENSSYVFRKDVGKPYNSFPLSYFYTLGGASHFDPTTYCTFTRDGTGYMAFGIPNDGTRTDFVVENTPLFLQWTSGTNALSMDVLATIPVPLRLTISGNSNPTIGNLTREFMTTNSVISIPISNFEDWSGLGYWIGVTGPYLDSGTVTITSTGALDTVGINVPVYQIALSASGLFWLQVSSIANWSGTNPPVVSYATTSNNIKIIVSDAAGWLWSKVLPTHSTVTFLTTVWADYTINSFQTNLGTPPGSPVTTGPIGMVQFQLASGTSGTLNLATVSDGLPNIPASTGSLVRCSIDYLGTGPVSLSIGNVQLIGGTRTPVAYYPGAVPFQIPFGISPVYATRAGTGAPFQGPAYAGYQNPVPWFLLGNMTAVGNVVQMLLDSQTAYAAQSAGTSGPFAPVYLWPTWDSVQYGTAATWSWNGPDPNTFWGGYQYRPFAAIADYWNRAVTAGSSDPSVAKAASITVAFLTWLDAWLMANPAAISVPNTFHAASPPQGGFQVEPHMTAVAMKATVWAGQAGANPTVVNRVRSRLYSMLRNLSVGTGDMQGFYSTSQAYGYWAGEIMDALAVSLGARS